MVVPMKAVEAAEVLMKEEAVVEVLTAEVVGVVLKTAEGAQTRAILVRLVVVAHRRFV